MKASVAVLYKYKLVFAQICGIPT